MPSQEGTSHRPLSPPGALMSLFGSGDTQDTRFGSSYVSTLLGTPGVDCPPASRGLGLLRDTLTSVNILGVTRGVGEGMLLQLEAGASRADSDRGRGAGNRPAWPRGMAQAECRRGAGSQSPATQSSGRGAVSRWGQARWAPQLTARSARTQAPTRVTRRIRGGLEKEREAPAGAEWGGVGRHWAQQGALWAASPLPR